MLKKYLQFLKAHWPHILALNVCITIVFWASSCPPRTKSLNPGDQLVTREELQLELDTFIKRAEIGMADLDQQEALRRLVLQNALLIVQAGTFNPVGLLTAFMAFYGVGSAGVSASKFVKKKILNP